MNDDEGARIRQLLDETLSEDDIVHENSEDEEDQLEIDVFEDTDDTDADPNFEVDKQSDVSDDDEDDDFSRRRQRKKQRLDYNILPCTSTPRTVTQLASTPRPASAPAATPQAFTPPAATPRAVTPQGTTPRAVTPQDTTSQAVTPPAATPPARGILVNSAACKDNHLTTRELFDNEWSGCRYKCVMNSERFEFILNCLRFDDRETRLERQRGDPFAPIRELWDDFVLNCKTKYRPGSYVTVDEQLLGFRGKCPFRMYIPNKPSKYGIKIVMACDTTTKYMINGIPYVGKKTQTGGQPLAEFFVKEITRPIHGTNRSVTMDNWFTSVSLAEDLLRDPYNLTLVGTIRANRKGVPSELMNKKERPVNTSLFLFDREKTLVSYKPKKNKVVLLLSTMHEGNHINDETHKPDIIHTYNETKGGVDAMDQLCNNMSCSRKTQRWPLAVFFGIMNISFVNSYVIYCTNNLEKGNQPANRRTFMKELFMDLSRPHMQNRLQIPSLRRGLRTMICGVLGIPDNPGAAPPPEATNGSIASIHNDFDFVCEFLEIITVNQEEKRSQNRSLRHSRMPPKKKPKFAYKHEDLLLALDDVKKGESINSASKRFGIPQSTLSLQGIW
ncbi:uncharacterized protein LOC124368317 [Homalodisca vitripennis]|uniref:uncharacterized protein LOC124368317 n=1 Tax=Homalodisca vitripennis TaxID=197043 RepID=UPI001EEB754E|nr:uncharacterized protein LOC124368317 [Homalodisca vitripennis]